MSNQSHEHIELILTNQYVKNQLESLLLGKIRAALFVGKCRGR